MIHLRLERRSATPAWLNLALPLLALAAALILCSGLVALAGASSGRARLSQAGVALRRSRRRWIMPPLRDARRRS